MYTPETLKQFNLVFRSIYKLEQKDVDTVNRYVDIIERTRGEQPRPGDIIEYTDEYGYYYHGSHVHGFDCKTGLVLVYTHSLTPFVFPHDSKPNVLFDASGSPNTSIKPDVLTYIGKRKKLFKSFGHYDAANGDSAVYFEAEVNVWEYIAPDQKHPGYSTKTWCKQYISYVEKPIDDSPYRYYGSFNSGIAFRNIKELNLWKRTFKAVGFPGYDANHSILFLYRETDKLVSRKEWDALDLPLDTRLVNGIIHVKVAYNDDAHMVTVYRFTNSGYLDSREFGEYERAKGTALVPSEAKVKKAKSIKK